MYSLMELKRSLSMQCVIKLQSFNRLEDKYVSNVLEDKRA